MKKMLLGDLYSIDRSWCGTSCTVILERHWYARFSSPASPQLSPSNCEPLARCRLLELPFFSCESPLPHLDKPLKNTKQFLLLYYFSHSPSYQTPSHLPFTTNVPQQINKHTMTKALYGALIQTPRGSIVHEDVSSNARLGAIYAQRALPGQRTTGWVQPAPTPMDPPELPSTSTRPPSYRPEGTLEQWATHRARLDTRRQQLKTDHELQSQAHFRGGLQKAVERRSSTLSDAQTKERNLGQATQMAPSKSSAFKRAGTPIPSGETDEPSPIMAEEGQNSFRRDKPIHLRLAEIESCSVHLPSTSISEQYKKAFHSWHQSMRETLPGYKEKKNEWMLNLTSWPGQACGGILKCRFCRKESNITTKVDGDAKTREKAGKKSKRTVEDRPAWKARAEEDKENIRPRKHSRSPTPDPIPHPDDYQGFLEGDNF